jgi:hypothetical protein
MKVENQKKYGERRADLSSGIYIYCKIRPGDGRGYCPMSTGGLNTKKVRQKRGNIKKKK